MVRLSDIHETIGGRFADADLETDRFVTVKEGEKACIDHDSRWDSPESVPGTNYGIYSDGDDQLVILDVDYHREGGEDLSPVALAALSALPLTLKLQSPHVPDGDRGGHRVYKLEGEETPAELFKRRLGTENPVPSWGEVLAKNKYAVGAGSQLDGCTKEWCETCTEADGGCYTVKNDAEIATVDPETLVDALVADPDLTDVEEATQSETLTSSTSEGKSGDYDDLDEEQVEELLEHVPGDQHFDDWIRTGYAVHSWDSGAKGKRLFKSWSRSNPKWEEPESQKQVDYIWDKGDPDGKATVGTLIHFAKENGWSPSWKKEEKSVEELIAEYSDEYDAPEDVPDDVFGTDLDEDTGEDAPREPSEATTWSDVRTMYQIAEEDPNYTKGNARQAAVRRLEAETNWMFVRESRRLWVYDPDTGTFDKYGEGDIGAHLVENLGKHYSKTEKSEIIARIKDRNQVHRDELNARQQDDPLLSVGNGVVNLRTGEIEPHSPEYRFVRGLEWDYDPSDADEETVIEFLDDVTERPEDRDTLLDHLAHGLMPGHPYRAFVVCYGPGGNGKTQVAELFREFVGGQKGSAAVEIDELTSDDFATGDLPGKFINWGDDMAGDGGGALKDLSLLKKATGGSEIRANEKFEKTFNFKNEAAMFFSANEPPRIGEKKSSIQDRIYPIRMPYRFTSDPDESDPLQKEKTPNISEKLVSDDAVMRGLLSLAVKHAQDLIETKGEYSQPESPEERLEKYNQSADPIVKFSQQALAPASGEYRVRKDDAYRVYQNMVESWSERATGARAFKRQFPRAFREEVETARSRALATADDEADRVKCWKRLQWTESARAQMPDWMSSRYEDHFDTDEDSDDDPDGSQETEEPLGTEDAYGAAPITQAADTLTGYVTVTAQVAATQRLGDDNSGLKVILKDESGAIDLVIWNEDVAEKFVDSEGETYVLEHVEVTEYDGKRQLSYVEGLTEMDSIQQGVGFTEGEPPEEGQTSIDTEAVSTDGGLDDGGVPHDAEGANADARRLANHVGSRILSKQQIQTECADEFGWDLERTEDLVEKAMSEGLLEQPKEGNYRQV